MAGQGLETQAFWPETRQHALLFILFFAPGGTCVEQGPGMVGRNGCQGLRPFMGHDDIFPGACRRTDYGLFPALPQGLGRTEDRLKTTCPVV